MKMSRVSKIGICGLIPVVASLLALPVHAQGVGDARVASIRATLQNTLRGVPRAALSDAKFAVAFVDLNGDGVDEAIVYGPQSSAPGWCGTSGCGLGVFARRGARYRLVSSTAIGWPPVGVLRVKHHGWRDITVAVEGGGIQPGYKAVLSYNGSRYPFNPSSPPANPLKGSPAEEILIKGYNTGIELTPLFP